MNDINRTRLDEHERRLDSEAEERRRLEERQIETDKRQAVMGNDIIYLRDDVAVVDRKVDGVSTRLDEGFKSMRSEIRSEKVEKDRLSAGWIIALISAGALVLTSLIAAASQLASS